MTTVDTRSVAEAILADLVLAAPSAFVAQVLQVEAAAMIATIQRHFNAAIVAYHEIICSACDPMTQCLCHQAVKEIAHYQPGRERN